MKTTTILATALALALALPGAAYAEKGGNGKGGGGGSDRGGESRGNGGDKGGRGNSGHAKSAEDRGTPRRNGWQHTAHVKPEKPQTPDRTRVNFGRVISGLNTGRLTATDVANLGGTFTVVDVGGLLRGNRVSALNNAVARNEDRLDDLREDIEANTTLSDALADEGITPDEVIGVTRRNGETVVYVYEG